MTTTPRAPAPLLRLTLVTGVIGLLVLLTGCASGGDESSSGGSTADTSEPAAEPGVSDLKGGADGDAAADTPGAGQSSKGAARQTAVTPALDRAVISTGQVTLHAAQVSRARAEVLRLVTSWGGTVADEQTSSDDRGRVVDSTMTLRVPSSRFGDAMDGLASVGEVEQQSRKSEDVTTQVIDNAARVRAAERSIRQIENLLRRATDLGDVIAIESDLARRQADLDSLKSQQAWLKDQTSLSTINVYLSHTPKVGPEEKEARGFLAGLDQGWDALRGATVALMTVLGAVLPFAVLAGLLGVPLWLLLRRRAGSSTVSGESAPARSA